MKKELVVGAVFGASLLALCATAFADPPGNMHGKSEKAHNGHGQSTEHRESYGDDHRGSGNEDRHDSKSNFDVDVSVIFGHHERDMIHDYYRHHDRSCPPGLAKKHNGCLPPGIAKKRYEIGHRIPAGVVVGDLPDILRSRLPHLPDGYGYRTIDGDVALIELSNDFIVGVVGRFD